MASLRNGVEIAASARGNDVVAVQQHGGADADGKPADGCDQRFPAGHQRLEKVDGTRIEVCALGGFEEIGDVVAGAVSSGRSRKHHAPDRVAFVRLAQRARHVVVHRQRQGVFLFRPVHPDGANPAIIGHGDSTGHRLFSGS